MNLAISLRSELLKTKRTAAFYFTIAAAAFAPFMSMLDILIDEGISPDDREIIFEKMLTGKFMMSGLVVLPLFVILVCTLLPQIEYKNNAWKQVLTSPKSKANIFLAKLINVHLLITLFLVTNLVMMLICAVILHFKDPSLNVLGQPVNALDVFMVRVNAYIAILAMCAIQFWLGLKFKNFIIPIAIGVASWFAGTIFVMEELGFAAYFPYSLHAYGRFPKYDPLVNSVGWTSLFFAVIFLVIGYLDFKRKKSTS